MAESVLGLVLDQRRAKRQGSAAIALLQRARFAELTAYARNYSPYYAQLFQHLPPHLEDAAQLPVTHKAALMANFDHWCTDREITLEKARAFVSEPQRIGDKFLGRYTLATTSGTTGTPGIFVLDDRSFAVTSALAVRMLGAWLSIGDLLKIILRGGRMAMINATGGHFASTVAAARLQKRRGKSIAMLSVQMPLAQIVSKLNAFQPAVMAPYASVGALLASEQQAKRLAIDPVLVVLSAEGLPDAEYPRIAAAFGSKLGHSYAATECPFLSYSCEEGWLHINSDWVIVEAVDAEYQPVAAGEQSHTVLITNLANHLQPIIRYDLGDSIVMRPDACPCGNSLPAIKVQGRSSEMMMFAANGGKVSVPPLALEIDVEGAALYQLVQSASDEVSLRLKLDGNADHVAAWNAALDQLKRALAAYGLDHVKVLRREEEPERTGGGKYRKIIPLKDESKP